MEIIKTTRPRNVNYLRAAGILYGDWGTSKAYVLGLAFALAGYRSFWFILAVSILTLLVGINYIKICNFYPNGGGVYASVRNRSKALSLIGAFFLISDYLITAALSAVSAFHYLGVPHTELWAIVAIIVIGMLNFLGPKHTGSLSLSLALPTVLCVILLSLMSLSFIPKAIEQLQPVSTNIEANWMIFVGVIVALSGIEAIANTTGSMKLDEGSTDENPSVAKTSTPAILMVMLEVCLFTSFLGLAMNALPGLEINNGDVDAPGYPNVRDAMLRYMAHIFGQSQWGPAFGHYFAVSVSIVFALLLLSAVNTALIALIALFFTMSKDEELPHFFQALNRFGVPHYSTLVAFVLPVCILFIISDVAGLANLYAIGFVGAIAINLGATSTNFKLPLRVWERVLMIFTCIVMALIELTLFIDKPKARGFVIAVVGIGLLLRSIISEQKQKIPVKDLVPDRAFKPLVKLKGNETNAMLVAVTGFSKSLDFALEMAQSQHKPLYILFLREQRIVVPEKNPEFVWMEDKSALDVMEYITSKSSTAPLNFLYTVTPHTTHSIVEIAKQKKVSEVILEKKRDGTYSLLHVLRGTTVKELSKKLPKHINLIVV